MKRPMASMSAIVTQYIASIRRTMNSRFHPATRRQCSRWLLTLASVLLSASSVGAQGLVMPSVPGQYFDDNGDPCAACSLYSYAAGTSTPLGTYSNNTLSTPNANPIVLDAAGRATIFLDPTLSYKFILKSSTGATIWTRDNIGAYASTTVDAAVCECRLTATSADPVPAADKTAATAVYLTPYQGYRIALYDGSAAWSILTFTETTLSIAGYAADTNYDVFAYNSNGSVALESVAWTNATTRATAIVLQNGVYVKTGATTRRYLGTFRTTATIGQTEDSYAKRFVWNYYNRKPRPMRVIEGTDSWTYTTSTLRQANGSTANQIAFVLGVAEVIVEARVVALGSNGGSVGLSVSIGEDSTSASAAACLRGNTANVAGTTVQITATYTNAIGIGYHYLAWLEYSTASGTTTWYGDNSSSAVVQSGIAGVIHG